MLVKTGYTISASALITAWAEQNPLVLKAEIKNEKAYISIRGVIWEYQNSSAWFVREIDQIISKGITDVEVFINSPGGDVFQANDIANQIDRFNGDMSGEGGAIVASAATYIAIRLKSFTMPENGQFMYHKPHGVFVGNEDKVKADLKLLKNITSNYRKRYSKKTGLSEEEIESRWSKGDVWLSAEEAKEQNFISEVTTAVDISVSDSSMIAACGAPIKHKPTPATPKSEKKPPKAKAKTQKSENKQMEHLKILALKLGLPETATQAEIDAKIQQLQSKANKSDQAEKEAKEDKEKKKKAEIKAFFDKSVKEKRLNAEQVKNMQSWAKSDFEGMKAYVEGIEPLEKPKVKGSGGHGTDKKKFEDYTEAELQVMEVEDSQKFNALYDAYLDQ